MTTPTYRALVVDDEVLVRNLTVRALGREGFTCDTAGDGNEALKLLRANRYHALVTDLRMPNRHGHALAVEVLGMKDRPTVVILTGVLEPKLAKDLIARGVDYVEFKPVNYELFAAKVKALALRRAQMEGQAGTGASEAEAAAASPAGAAPAPGPARPAPVVEEGGEASVKRLETEGKLLGLSKVLPLSQAAFDVFNMASSDAFEMGQIAAAIKRDASLAADVLKLANSAFYNTTGHKIVDMEEAVVRIGQRRIGELALATSVLATVTANVLPWMNMELAWRRSIAAGVAVELLLEYGGYSASQEALFLSALMHSLGRVALGMSYPQRYQQMIRACREHKQPLLNYERREFGMTDSEVMARLLEAWEVPTPVYEPLRFVAEGYAVLARLAEPLRTKTELVKLAVLVGWIASGPWEPWDLIEFPPESVLQRQGIETFADIIRQTRSDTQRIVNMRTSAQAARFAEDNSTKEQAALYEVAYCNLSGEPFDFLMELLPGLKIQPRPCEKEALGSAKSLVVNCIRMPPHRLAGLIGRQPSDAARLIVTDAENLEPYGRFGRVLGLPAAYGAFQEACAELTGGRRAGA